MKKLVFVMLLCIGGWWLHHRQPEVFISEDESFDPPSPSPSPTPSAVRPSNLSSQAQISIPRGGLLYLLRHTSVPSPDGVHGVAVGTRVETVEDRGNSVFVTDGSFSFVVPRSALTGDASTAQEFAAKDAERQRALGQWRHEQKALADARERERHTALERERIESAQRLAANAPPPLGSRSDNPLDRTAYDQKRAFRRPAIPIQRSAAGEDHLSARRALEETSALMQDPSISRYQYEILLKRFRELDKQDAGFNSLPPRYQGPDQ
jgi:hypothetical protein